MLNLILWLVAGSLVGSLAGYGIQAPGGTALNILAATIGAVIGGFLFTYITLDILTLQSAFNLNALLISFIGAGVLLVIVRLVRPASVNPN